MFVAKFSETSGDPFKSDKNGNFPFIGEVLAGKAKGTLINGTMFKRDNYSSDKLYFCDNVEEIYEGKPQIRVQVLGVVSPVEYLELRTKLGAGKLITAGEAVEETKAAQAAKEDSLV